MGHGQVSVQLGRLDPGQSEYDVEPVRQNLRVEEDDGLRLERPVATNARGETHTARAAAEAAAAAAAAAAVTAAAAAAAAAVAPGPAVAAAEAKAPAAATATSNHARKATRKRPGLLAR